MKTNLKVHQDLEKLRAELHMVRKSSLQASRQGDFRRVGYLTAQAAKLNSAIRDAQGILDLE
jgi:hypothetical protein